MKTILTISMMAILATAAIMPGLQDAFALKADTSEKKGPKSYGQKTISKIIHDEYKTHVGPYDGLKSEQIKSFKKQIADMTAKEIFKQLYRLG